MGLILKLIALAFLAISLIDGAFTRWGFDPWDNRADLPEGFFTLLRISVTAAAAFAAWEAYQLLGRPNSFAILYGFIAVLFQPFVMVRFEYETWQWIDLITFLFIAGELYLTIRIGQKILKTLSGEEDETK